MGPHPPTSIHSEVNHAPPNHQNLLLIRSVESVLCQDRRGRRLRCLSGVGVGPAGRGRSKAPAGRIDGRRGAGGFAAGDAAGRAGGPGGECWREGGCGDVGTRRSAAERGGRSPCAGPDIGGPANERRCRGRRWCGACRSRRCGRRLPAVWPTGLREVPPGRWPSRSPLQWSLLAGELSGPLPGASGSIRLLRDPLAIVARAGGEASRPLRSCHDARRPSSFRSAEDGR